MNIDAVIAQIKAYAPIYNGNVAGAAAYANGLADQVWLPRPACYVIPLQDEVDPNSLLVGLRQTVREKIGIIVDLDNSADRRGQGASTDAVGLHRAALFKAVLNWRSDPLTQSRGFAYDGGGLVPDGMNRAWLRWQFDFAIETLITEADGWQQPSVPLIDINTTIASAASGKTLAVFDAPLAQP